jgi:hypothetical protein
VQKFKKHEKAQKISSKWGQQKGNITRGQDYGEKHSGNYLWQTNPATN